MSSPKPSPRRSRLRRILFGTWVLFASWVLLELTLQVGALMFRESETGMEVEPDLEAFRVLAVGDSWVAGAEAPDGMGFVDHLGRDIPNLLGPESRVQLTNLGRTGANSAYVALTVHETLPQLLPDLLVVLVGQNNATNFYQVAEVEELLGRRARFDPLRGLRTVKLLRIALANARGSSGYRSGQPETLPSIPPMKRDDQERPLLQLRILGSKAGQDYLNRRLNTPPPASSDPAESLSWQVLQAATKRDLAAAEAGAEALRHIMGLQGESVTGSAPKATSDRELLARYALLRLARQQRDWRAVRYHGGAFVDYEPRCLLSDLGAAEAHLLAGDWRTSRAYLTSAHNLGPGFLDTVDLASRIPAQARNPAIYEALEFRPLGLPQAYEMAPVLDQTNQEEDAAAALAAWIGAVPGDDTIRADLAVWLVDNGRRPEADALMGVQPNARDRVPPPSNRDRSVDQDMWRYLVTRAKATGDRDHTLATVQEAVLSAEPTADLLGAASASLAAHKLCESLPDIADRWFLSRGDGNAYVRVLTPCMEPGLAAERLRSIRAAWIPLGDPSAWTALVKAGHRPFDLLYRDLDLVLERAEETGAKVVLVNYPNPSDDHTALRDVLGDYAADRAVEYVDLWGGFETRFAESPDRWAAHLGPNGHANQDGYRLMADDILEHLRMRRLLANRATAE